jgi:hypothetical protein
MSANRPPASGPVPVEQAHPDELLLAGVAALPE